MLYYPDRTLYVDPDKLEHPPEEVTLKKEGQPDLSAWHFSSRDPEEKPKVIILFSHGNAQNISSHFLALYWVLDHGYDFFIYDYPGYGKSEGEPTPKNTVESAHRALNYIKERWPETPYVIFGQSLGGTISLKLASELKDKEKLCFVLVESAFGSYKRVAQTALSGFWLTWPVQLLPHLLLSDRYAPGRDVKKISPTPLYVMHAKTDPVVKYHLGQKVYDLAEEPKEFWTVPSGHHIDGFLGSHAYEFQQKFLSVLKSCH